MQNWDNDRSWPDSSRPENGMSSSSGGYGGNGGGQDQPAFQTSTPLPKGGGAIRGIDEKFKVNAANGTSSFSLPLPYSPSRQGFVPPVSLNYSSGDGNGAFGLGWSLGVPSIRRRTRNYLPRYEDQWESDIFQLSDTEDLVPLLTQSGGVWSRSTEPRTVGGIDYMIAYYRPRIEGPFSRIERWTNLGTAETFWRALSAGDSCSYYGLTAASRISDPQDPGRVFEWLLCEAFDDKGNLCVLNYKTEDGAGVPALMSEKNHVGNCTQVYLSSIWYGNIEPFYPGGTPSSSGGTTGGGGSGGVTGGDTPWGDLPDEDQFLFRMVFDYGEHDTSVPVGSDIYTEIQPWTCRKDPFSSYRSGFDIRTYRRCSRVLMFHCFPNKELPLNPYLVRSLNLFYDDDLSLVGNGDEISGFSFLVRATQYGYLWDPGANNYSSLAMPDIDMQYQQHEWNVQVQEVSPASLAGAPAGVDDRKYQWVDLFSEGIMGILTEQGDGWYYKSNLGGGSLAAAMALDPIPSYRGLGPGMTTIRDLEGDGVKYLVQDKVAPQAYFKLSMSGPDVSPNGQFAAVGGQPVSSGGPAAGPASPGLSPNGQWQKPGWFRQFPVLDPQDRNARYIDLTEDGREDILYTGDQEFRWYESLGEKGFRMAGTVPRAFDEEKGPAIVFADRDQSICLADMTGDGRVDIVRIRNGEVCYWPNLGYARFGAKMGMDNAPVFDSSDGFNPSLLRLADVDGSGTTDLIYLGHNGFQVWMNINGNGWPTTPETISPFPKTDGNMSVEVLDFLGTGTACIVCSSPYSNEPLRYIDLMGSQKPCLLTGYSNNCGKEVALEYATSTSFYLADKQAGLPWITRLPFAVQCVSKVTTSDLVRETVYTNTFSYHHGYFDPYDKEFRGFARVEQQDTESFAQFVLNSGKNVVEQDIYQPPVRTVTWFHTGAYLRQGDFVSLLSGEYFKNPSFTEYAMPAPLLPAGMDPDDLHEAYRACKGLALRREVYADDGSVLANLPYSASQSNAQVTMLQPRGPNRYASFLVTPVETISYDYERIPADPRIGHSIVMSVDQYGNVTKSAAVVYPRVSRPTGAAAIPDTVWNQQDQFYVTTLETDFTNDITWPDNYRLRTACETRHYEIGGLTQPAGFYFTLALLNTDLPGIPTIPYEQNFTGGIQQRLYRHNRGYFATQDLSGVLPLGQQAVLGIAYQSFVLAFTQGLVNQYYGTKVTTAMLTAAMYTHSEGDADWWIPSGTVVYPADPAADFYIPEGSLDPFGNLTTVTMDTYFLLTESVTDALLNVSSSVNDYRTLSPVLITDPNLNQSAVQTDELGMTIALALMGKEGGSEGDTLADPTLRIEYDNLNWQNTGQPNYAHYFAREMHGPANPGWLESFIYSDGCGSVIMTKAPAAPGIASQWNPATQSVEQVDANPRWIGNGRTILNNKGNPVKQYEPYFSASSGYETESALVETGMTAILYYDPLDRNILTDFPDGTLAKVEFDSWMTRAFDNNDTVMDSAWYASLGSPSPSGPEPSDPHQRAAWLAAMDYNTPAVSHMDVLGRPFYSIADYGGGVTSALYTLTDLTGRYANGYDQLGRNVAQAYTSLLGQNMYSVMAEKGQRWSFNDVMGRMVNMWDNDICVYATSFDALSRPLSNYITQGGSTTVLAHFVYGETLGTAAAQALNLLGRVYQLYDQAGCVIMESIDFKGNIVESSRNLCLNYQSAIDWTPIDGLTDITAINTAAAPLLDTTETFQNALTVDALNRPVTVSLPDGSVLTPVYDPGGSIASLSGNVMGAATPTQFLVSQSYNARGQRLSAQYGNNTAINYAYDPATFRLTNILTLQHPADPASQSLQDITYYFDPVGNVTQVMDDAQQTRYFKNAVVYPENKFTYDALYQLTSGTGREHAGQGMDTQRNSSDIPVFSPIPEVNDVNAVRNYTENYAYDLCGNILSLQHIATGASWTQNYQYQYQVNPADNTNRLAAISQPGDGPGVFSGAFGYTGGWDAGLHGNMTAMPGLPAGSLTYSVFDQLASANLGGGGTAYYVYGAGGGRMRKVIERQGGTTVERIYLGPVEIYREQSSTGTTTFERYTLHVADSQGRFVQVDTKTIDEDNSDPVNALGVANIRYQYSNHLGSAVLETDVNGQIISYEEYHPFGTSSYRVSQSGYDISLKRYRFCGKERDDETGFYYSGARYYAAWLGRWTTSDPGGFVDGFNVWRYCRNSPVCLNDPTGTDPGGNIVSDASPDIPQHIRDDVTTNSDDARRELETYYHDKVIGDQQLVPGSFHWDAEKGQNWAQFRTVGSAPDGSGSGGPGADAGAKPGASGAGGAGSSGGSGSAGGSGDGSNSGAAAGANAGAGGAGTKAVTQNPEGETLEVPNNFDDEKIAAYKDRITSDRGVGIRGEPPGGGSRTADLRRANQGLRDAFENSIGGRPAGTQIDHTVELQHIIRGNQGGADTVRALDHRVQPTSLNASQGSSAQQVNRRAIAAGALEDVPAGGVARTADLGRFYNSRGFRSVLRGAGYALMVAGPALTAYGSSQISNPGVRYGGYGAASVEAAGVAYYSYGRFALQGATGEAAGVAAMNVGSRLAMGAGGAAQFLISGYFAVTEFQRGEYVAAGFDAAAALGGLALIAAAVVASPALATGLVVAGVVTGIAAGVYHIGNAFHWW